MASLVPSLRESRLLFSDQLCQLTQAGSGDGARLEH